MRSSAAEQHGTHQPGFSQDSWLVQGVKRKAPRYPSKVALEPGLYSLSTTGSAKASVLGYSRVLLVL